MRSSKGGRGRQAAPKTAPTTVCYCDGKRELGSVEVVCSTCLKWFHGRCLKEFHEFSRNSNGVPFMICYTFTCKQCRPTAEDWKAKKADLVQMCVTVLATLSAERLKADGKLSAEHVPEDFTYLSLKDEIVPYMNENWYMLTAIKQKKEWHQNLAPTLLKEKNIFVQHNDDDDLFALAEKNLSLLGPLHEAVKLIGKRPIERENREPRHIELPPIEGPKTRGASKRRHAEAPVTGKKQKLAADYSSTAAPNGVQIDIPFSKDNYRYYLTEVDPNVPEDPAWNQNQSSAYVIPSFHYRELLNPTVNVSSNDRAFQLSINGNSITGFEGYSMARASHGVSKGTWYFEVNFDDQPDDSHIRIGWSQSYASLQACVGYNKFSYGWRSKHGTKFHEAKGKKYHFGGFKQGDVLGCLIHLPVDKKLQIPANLPSEKYLPVSHKGFNLISFKANYFFEVQEESADIAKTLVEMPGSYIEFFHNGKSCGKAYENIYAGAYYPSISIFKSATATMNLGPKFRNLPRGATGIHARADEQQHEQTLSDMLYLVSKEVNLDHPPRVKREDDDDVKDIKKEIKQEI
ncbi:B30.2/SPRY domain-containing protein [Caenorhabditis elegans]|uniref:B30.2/SPRY domain-containing protein n=1 Tax=Caenorhabditis elegans TaxID=6239 RepID=Q9XXH4_CAEEL|nr:B30.2/SPRY domain-containing protein [Caenorhabditis elegans]CAA19468.1 B30.2/SPRY domain-containing protein [Caenorhabditis elegans]|eukprot:NP_496553.1 Set1/Ash2 histone methyltransferase complex subunit ash-2 [Caenorhabditis elegans]